MYLGSMPFARSVIYSLERWGDWGQFVPPSPVYLLRFDHVFSRAHRLLLVRNFLHWRCCPRSGKKVLKNPFNCHFDKIINFYSLVNISHKESLKNLIRNKTSILQFRPRFLTKSRLAFTIFNSLLIGLLLIHFAASQFYDKNSDQPPNMVFPALFATGMYFKAEKSEIYFAKLEESWKFSISRSRSSKIETSDVCVFLQKNHFHEQNRKRPSGERL